MPDVHGGLGKEPLALELEDIDRDHDHLVRQLKASPKLFCDETR